jgi:polyhydroxyalkanoate synthesis regulator phasin
VGGFIMNSFLKSGFLLGLGAAVAGKEKIDESIMKLVEKGSMTQSEADTVFDTFFKKARTKVTNGIRNLRIWQEHS